MTLLERRKAKYPDTITFKYYNANPKGKITCDCVSRALCTAMDKPYEQVVREIAETQCRTGYDSASTEGIAVYLKEQGWTRCKQPRKSNGKKYTGEEFCSMLIHPTRYRELKLTDKSFNKNKVIANIGGHHIVAIVDGRIHDTWDSTQGSIGIVWVKEE